MSSSPYSANPPSYHQSDDFDLEDGSHGEEELVSKHDRFQYSMSNWRDLGFAIAFLIHLGIVATCVLVAARKLYSTGGFSQPYEDSSAISLVHLLGFVGVTSGVAVLFSYVFLIFAQRQLEDIMTLSYWAVQIALVVSCAISLFTSKSLKSVIGYAILIPFTIWYFHFIRNRIPLANSMIKAVLQATSELPSLIPITIAIAIVQVAWQATWVFLAASVGIANGYFSAGRADAGSQNNSTYVGPTVFFLIFSYFWTTAVIDNISHVTSAGSIASWWLLPAHTRRSVVGNALRRACTTSLGSICFGSLILATLQTLRAIFSLFRKQDEGETTIAQCIAECILSCLERIQRIANYYAFTYVAVYGHTFIEAASKVSNLFDSSKGFESLINDDISNFPLLAGKFVVALFTAASAAIWVKVFNGSFVGTSGTVHIGVYMLIAAMLGFAVSSVIFSVIASGVTTTFVLWAESPAELASVQRPFYLEMTNAAKNIDKY